MMGAVEMSQFDQFIKQAKSAADAAGKKTGEFVELSKLKLSAGQIRSQIKEKEEKLGNAVYLMHKEGYQNDQFVEATVKELDELTEQLTEVEEKINRLKKTISCPCCGAVNPLESLYCGQCGCKLNNDSEQEEDVQEKIVTDQE